MKTKISILMVLLAYTLSAQFNKTYDINASDDLLITPFNVATSDLGSATVSWGQEGSTGVNYFTVTRHDASGNVIFNTRISPNQVRSEGFTHVRAMIQTEDEGFLVAGYFYFDEGTTRQPFLVKITPRGLLDWIKYYHVNSSEYKGFDVNKISLARVEDEEKELYFIVSTAQSDNRKSDNVVNVIKVDAKGNQLWSKKYNQGPIFSPAFSNVRDLVGDIAYSPDDHMYMITGWRQHITISVEHRMFFFGIDKDGNMVTRYKTVEIKGIPEEQDMVYDETQRCFAVSYTNRGASELQSSGLGSGIGLLTINSGLVINLRKLYWNKLFVENEAISISLVQGGGYTISGTLTENTRLRTRNAFLLKVEKDGGPVFLMRYNILDNAIVGHHVRSSGFFARGDQYILAAEQKTDLRVIRTNANGEVCGSVEEKVEVTDIASAERVFRYSPTEVGEEKEIKAQELEIKPAERQCIERLEEESYRGVAAGISENAAHGLNIYPTELSASNPVITIDNNTAASISLQVMDISGKVISTANVGTGKNTVSLGSSPLAEGIYFVKYQSGNGAVSGNSKLVLTR